MAALRRMLLQFLAASAAAYGIVVLFTWLTQDRLVYFPHIGGVAKSTPAQVKLPFEDVRITTTDGETLAAWWVPAEPMRGAVLLLHGNAGSIAERIDYLPHFHAMGYAVLLPDYRGYGASTGKPSEQGTYLDAQAAWRWLTGERGIKPGAIVVAGESLGGAVAAELAARVQPGSLILISTFTSVQDLGSEIYPWLPVRLISRYRYDTLAHLRNFRGPVLIAHSRDDEIVPFAHAERLFAAASGDKALLEMRGGHNNGFLFSQPSWVRTVSDFLLRHAASAVNQ
ncbi:MAG: alpha/beta hydrolase [Burkholderiales bacterium]|nr:alpha/beta hydrolase [Burkholderiales bacterium]